MKLLFVTNVFPNPVDPTKGLFNHYLARALAAEHEVSVIAPISWLDELQRKRGSGKPMPPARAETIDGVSVYYPRYFYPPKILRSRYGWFYRQSVQGCMRRVVDRHSPDAVLSFWVHPDGEVAVRAAHEHDVPAVVVVGGSDVLLLSNDASRRKRISNVLRSADAVVAVSSDLKDHICDLGVCSEDVHVWRRGIEMGVFSPGDRVAARNRLGIPAAGPALVWVGRMVPVKGLDVLLDACAILRRRHVGFRLYLVGDGPLRSHLEKTSRALGLGETVSFVGPRLHDELPDWYRAANWTVLPSRSEGMPNVLRESLACGTPFIASRVGGIPELAAEQRQRLVPPGDPSVLANAIADAFGDGKSPPLSTRLPTSWPESARALVRIIEPLVRNGSVPSVTAPELEAAIA